MVFAGLRETIKMSNAHFSTSSRFTPEMRSIARFQVVPELTIESDDAVDVSFEQALEKQVFSVCWSDMKIYSALLTLPRSVVQTTKYQYKHQNQAAFHFADLPRLCKPLVMPFEQTPQNSAINTKTIACCVPTSRAFCRLRCCAKSRARSSRWAGSQAVSFTTCLLIA